ncbi:hypothetical protein IAG41_13835 [Sphingomonas sp. JC676]|uniref:hypothetical protein n=1 Tax=Sphingomonas sp. JC676 TaxID=2768065 RepID=UPI001657D193|nr:hypothetical protein [Sphingomonas sp. JC676]MBC9033472.1 hypothetical protein [Sphingomonas sp. JC676]
MTSRKTDKDESIIGRGADAASGRTGTRRPTDRDNIRERLESGELVIEFESEEPEETLH